VGESAPALASLRCAGTDPAAALLVAAVDSPERLKSEAAFARWCGMPPSSGKTRREILRCLKCYVAREATRSSIRRMCRIFPWCNQVRHASIGGHRRTITL
jgi:Transposase IS116/IS110/IS902 family